MLGFLEQQEPPGGTLVTARHHNKDARGALIHKKCYFSYFCGQEPPGADFVPPSTRFLIVGR